MTSGFIAGTDDVVCLSGVSLSAGRRYASFDGDADRLVYYCTDSGAD